MVKEASTPSQSILRRCQNRGCGLLRWTTSVAVAWTLVLNEIPRDC